MILIGGIVFAVIFITYMAWACVQGSVSPIRRYQDDEVSVEEVPMKQFFHMNV